MSNKRTVLSIMLQTWRKPNGDLLTIPERHWALGRYDAHIKAGESPEWALDMAEEDLYEAIADEMEMAKEGRLS